MLRSWLAVVLVFGVPLSAQAQFGSCGWPEGGAYSSYYAAPISYYGAPQLPTPVVPQYVQPDCGGHVVPEMSYVAASPSIPLLPPAYSQGYVMAPAAPPVCSAPLVALYRQALPSSRPPERTPDRNGALDSSRSLFITARSNITARSSSPTFEIYPAALPDKAQGAVRCPVNVWNLTATAQELTIDGQRASLPAGRSQTFEVNREFEWQLEGRDKQKMAIPSEDKGRTIVIRR